MSKSKFSNTVKQMPALSHKPNQHYSVYQSDVINWLVAQPDVRQYLFDLVTRKKMITFNPHTRQWCGTERLLQSS